jgi:transposase
MSGRKTYAFKQGRRDHTLTITAVGIDLAKSVFHVVAVNRAEKRVFSKSVRRPKLLDLVRSLPPETTIFMEACGSAHYWGKRFVEAGHRVQLIAGQHVKKFVGGGNKNDAKDAEAIVVCGLRPSTRFVPLKSDRQLQLQALHRIRSRLVGEKTALGNELRALLYEHGIIICKGKRALKSECTALLEQGELSPLLEQLVTDLLEEFSDKAERVKSYDRLIAREAAGDERVARLMTIPCVGILSATALACEVSDPSRFKNGREFAAFLGLVPRHSGTGGKTTNLAISKRGDKYIRTLLVQGAQSGLRLSKGRSDKLSLWSEDLKQRRGVHKAAIALAAKNARIAWRLLASGDDFKPNLAAS